jgi:hypothetical protein
MRRGYGPDFAGTPEPFWRHIMSNVYRDQGSHAPHSRHPFVPRHRATKKWDHEKLYTEVLGDMASAVAVWKVRQAREPNIYHYCVLFREKVEEQYKASTADVLKVFMRLNREGLLSHKRRHFAHDSSRDPMFGFKGWSGWAANIYDINTERLS